MKKSILPIVLLLTIFSTAFAGRPSSATDRARASFQKVFCRAVDVRWQEKSNFAIATFRVDKETMFAYYDVRGNMMALVQNILSNRLPAYLRNDLQKHYKGYWISALFKITNESGDHYFVQLKNADETIVLTTLETDLWHTYEMPKDKANNL